MTNSKLKQFYKHYSNLPNNLIHEIYNYLTIPKPISLSSIIEAKSILNDIEKALTFPQEEEIKQKLQNLYKTEQVIYKNLKILYKQQHTIKKIQKIMEDDK